VRHAANRERERESESETESSSSRQEKIRPVEQEVGQERQIEQEA
jgi:hypothetical protein